MRKIYCLIIALLLLFAFPIGVLAEEEPTPTPSPTPTISALADDPTPAVNALTIDTKNLYDGMSKTYAQGYTPTITSGNVRIVLPLLDKSNALNGASITVTPKVYDVNSPVLLSNRQFSVTKGISSDYLIDFTVPLAKDRFNGKYSVVIQVSYTSAGAIVTQDFDIVLYIKDGKDPNATPPPEPIIKPTSQPIVMITGHTQTPQNIEAGQEFSVAITLENTNEKKGVQNMTVTATTESPHLTLLNETNSFYYKSLAKSGELDIELKYKTSMEAPAGKYTISLHMNYDNADAQTLSSSGLVTVEISQPMRVEMEMQKMPQELNAGDTLPLSFSVMNLGRGKVYNVRVVLNAPGLLPNSSAFIGNMEAGTSGDADMNIFVGTKDMSDGYEGTDKYGYTNGVATLIYEDENGKEYTQEFELSTTINTPIINAVSDEVDIKPEKAGQWWISLIVAGALAAGVGAFLIVRKRKRQNDENNNM